MKRFLLLWGFPSLLFSAVPASAQDQASAISHVRNNGYLSQAVVPSDTVALPRPTSAVFNGNSSACNIVMELNGDAASLTWYNVQPGEFLPVQAVLIKSTGTTCTNLVAIYDR